MAYIVAWSVIEKVKNKKNALFIFPDIRHDLFEIKKRKRDAASRFNGLLKTNALAVVLARVEKITVQK